MNTTATNIESKLTIGTRVEMTAENSNWNVGELGTIVWIGEDRVAVAFDGRDDDYTAFIGDFRNLN